MQHHAPRIIGRYLLSPAIAGMLMWLGFCSLSTATTKDVRQVAGQQMEVLGDLRDFSLTLSSAPVEQGLDIVTLKLTRSQAAPPPQFSLKWAIPSRGVTGNWRPSGRLDKLVPPDWAPSTESSMLARGAPVSTLYGGDDSNVQTVAVSDALNTVKIGSGVREEDGLIYNQIQFFSEPNQPVSEYAAELRIDRRPIHYWTALREVSDWWAHHPGYQPAVVPAAARLPLYSSWYNFHQSLDPGKLLKELELAKQVGFESVILDDGWQTLDSSRGYAFTGDWQPERIPDMRGFVEAAHKIGVKVLLWYSVPLVGKDSKVAERFKDKSLRYDKEIGAYTLDPRFPDVRRYLIDVYARALVDWKLDGVKLDFIDEFGADDKTVFEAIGGRDIASVNEATDRLMTAISDELHKINPDVLIEFRQRYIGPLMRKYGNMFRSSDCPNSYVMNRVNIADLRLLAGNTAVHSDMIMWYPDEPVELAALQMTNILFSVPQVSMRLREVPKSQLQMIRFYTDYWRANRAVLLDGSFQARSPAANYPLLVGTSPKKTIFGLYENQVVLLDSTTVRPAIDIVNGKNSDQVVISTAEDLGPYRYVIRDSQGQVTKRGGVELHRGVEAFSVPVSGVLALER
jgi:alpha-galactosidase